MESDFLSGILAEAAMKAVEKDDEAEDMLVEKIAKRDWKMLQEYMKQGFTREEAIEFIKAFHN